LGQRDVHIRRLSFSLTMARPLWAENSTSTADLILD
jgi:hypothetical protein